LIVHDSMFEVGLGVLKLKLSVNEFLQTYGVERKAFEGAVIDLETDEQPFSDDLKGAHRYRNFSVTCCGFLDKNIIEIIAGTSQSSDELFVRAIDEKVKKTDQPYCAFNAGFDMALLSKLLKRDIQFQRELQQYEMQKKEYFRQNLGISNFDDPFNGQGFLAAKEWTNYLKTGDVNCVKKIIAHNLACVSTEYAFLILQGYREIKQNSCKAFLEGKNELLCDNCRRL